MFKTEKDKNANRLHIGKTGPNIIKMDLGYMELVDFTNSSQVLIKKKFIKRIEQH